MLSAGRSQSRVLLFSLIATLMFFGIVAAMFFAERAGGLRWTIATALIGTSVGLVVLRFLLAQRKWVFDLDARRVSCGRVDMAFEDVAGLVIDTAQGEPYREPPGRTQMLCLGLVIRSPHSDLAERVLRLQRELHSGTDTATALAELSSDLRKESRRLSDSASRVQLFHAAHRLARELDCVLIDLLHPPQALAACDLRLPLGGRPTRLPAEAGPADPPPAGVREVLTADGLTLHFRPPLKNLFTEWAVTAMFVVVPLAIFFLLPSHNQDMDFPWLEAWPYLLAVFLLGPAMLIHRLWSKNRLEINTSRLRWVHGFFRERSQEIELNRLLWLAVDSLAEPSLVVLWDPQPMEVSMPIKAARWIKYRLERYLAGL